MLIVDQVNYHLIRMDELLMKFLHSDDIDVVVMTVLLMSIRHHYCQLVKLLSNCIQIQDHMQQSVYRNLCHRVPVLMMVDMQQLVYINHRNFQVVFEFQLTEW